MTGPKQATIAITLGIAMHSVASMGFADILEWQFPITDQGAWIPSNWDPPSLPDPTDTLWFEESSGWCRFEQPSSPDWIETVGQIYVTADCSSWMGASEGTDAFGTEPTVSAAILIVESGGWIMLRDWMWLHLSEVADSGGLISIFNGGRLSVSGDLLTSLSLEHQEGLDGPAPMAEFGGTALLTGSDYLQIWTGSLSIGGNLIYQDSGVQVSDGGVLAVEGLIDGSSSSLSLSGEIRCGGFKSDGNDWVHELRLEKGMMEVGSQGIEFDGPEDWEIRSISGDLEVRLIHGGSFNLPGTLTLRDNGSTGDSRDCRFTISSQDSDGSEVTSQRSQATLGQLLTIGDSQMMVVGLADLTVTGSVTIDGGGEVGTGTLTLSQTSGSIAEEEGPSLNIGGDLTVGDTASGVMFQIFDGAAHITGDVLVGQSTTESSYASFYVYRADDVTDNPHVDIGGDMLLGILPNGTIADVALLELTNGEVDVSGALRVGDNSSVSIKPGSSLYAATFECPTADQFQLTGGDFFSPLCTLGSGTLSISDSSMAQIHSLASSSNIEVGADGSACDLILGSGGSDSSTAQSILVGGSTGSSSYLSLQPGASLNISGNLNMGATGVASLSSSSLSASTMKVTSGAGLYLFKSEVNAFHVLGLEGSLISVGTDSVVQADYLNFDDIACRSSSKIQALEHLTFEQYGQTTITVDAPCDSGGVMQSPNVWLGGDLHIDVSTYILPGVQVPLIVSDSEFFGSIWTVQIDSSGGGSAPGVNYTNRITDTTVWLDVTAAIPGDGNVDGVVDAADLTRLITTNWNETEGASGHDWSSFQVFNEDDYDQNGVVNVHDLLLLLSNWTG